MIVILNDLRYNIEYISVAKEVKKSFLERSKRDDREAMTCNTITTNIM